MSAVISMTALASLKAFMALFDELLPLPPEGLEYFPHFLTGVEETELVDLIDSLPWNTEWSRRRQFYGAAYSSSESVLPFPELIQTLAERLYTGGLVREVPDQALVNEYLPGQGITAHIDHHPEFGDQVVIVSLLDSYPMRFQNTSDGAVYEQWLDRLSACVIAGPSRYLWTHEIVKRRADVLPGGGRKARGRRLSVTYRKLAQTTPQK